MGLGNLGLGNIDKAAQFLGEVVKLDINHQGGSAHLAMCEK